MSAAGFRRFASLEVASSELSRDINRDHVLERIRALEPVSRVELARASGLQPSTVSLIVEQLLGERWIRESALVKTARGRRPTLLSLNDEVVVLVADIRPTFAVVALVDLNGRILARQVVPMGADAARCVQSLAAAMQHMRERHARQTLVGVGVSIPGRIHRSTGEILISPNLRWQGSALGRALSRALGLEVAVENAANCSLLAELWFGSRERVRNAVLLTISDGIGAAILAESRLIAGQHGLAGEFGHISVDPAGPLCACGQRGCWEMVASSRAALSYYRQLKPTGVCSSFLELVGLAMDGQAAAITALKRQAIAIGRGLHLVNATLSPELILFAGDLTAGWEMSKGIIERESTAGLMAGSGPTLRSIGDGEMARLRGASAVVLDRLPGYYRATQQRLQERLP